MKWGFVKALWNWGWKAAQATGWSCCNDTMTCDIFVTCVYQPSARQDLLDSEIGFFVIIVPATAIPVIAMTLVRAQIGDSCHPNCTCWRPVNWKAISKKKAHNWPLKNDAKNWGWDQRCNYSRGAAVVVWNCCNMLRVLHVLCFLLMRCKWCVISKVLAGTGVEISIGKENVDDSSTLSTLLGFSCLLSPICWDFLEKLRWWACLILRLVPMTCLQRHRCQVTLASIWQV